MNFIRKTRKEIKQYQIALLNNPKEIKEKLDNNLEFWQGMNDFYCEYMSSLLLNAVQIEDIVMDITFDLKVKGIRRIKYFFIRKFYERLYAYIHKRLNCVYEILDQIEKILERLNQFKYLTKS